MGAKVLIYRQVGGIGDQLCCEPAIRAARARYPDAHITWAVGEPFLPLFFDNPTADAVISPDPWEFDFDSFDLDFHLEGPETDYAQSVGYDIKKSRIENWCERVDGFPDNMCPRWKPSQKERSEIAGWLSEANIVPGRFVLVQWQSAIDMKNYPRMPELIERLKAKYSVVVTNLGPVPDMGVCVATDLDYRMLGALTEQAALAVGPDSCLSHFAAATKTPFVGIYGPTDASVYLKHYPLAEYVMPGRPEGLPCSDTFPCWGVAERNWWCRTRPSKTPWCLETLDPDLPASLADKMWNKYRLYNDQKRQRILGDPTGIWTFDPTVDTRGLREALEVIPVGVEIRHLDRAPILRSEALIRGDRSADAEASTSSLNMILDELGPDEEDLQIRKPQETQRMPA